MWKYVRQVTRICLGNMFSTYLRTRSEDTVMITLYFVAYKKYFLCFNLTSGSLIVSLQIFNRLFSTNFTWSFVPFKTFFNYNLLVQVGE